MKSIGIIGGVGWSSTIYYYKLINEKANELNDNLSAPNIHINSLDFEPLKELQLSEKWNDTVPILSNAASELEAAGADFILIASATTNISCKEVENNLSIPLLDIVEPTAKAICSNGIKKIGLLGTKPTMEHSFFRSRLIDFGISTIVPSSKNRQFIHDVIYNELCRDIIKKSSKEKYLRIVENLVSKGAEGIILGCTEIPLLIGQKDIAVPIFDIAKLHALEALNLALDCDDL